MSEKKVNRNEEFGLTYEKVFNLGYRHGYKGIPLKPERCEFDGYYDGWDAGNCDRPTLDELMPIDVAKERSTGCLD